MTFNSFKTGSFKENLCTGAFALLFAIMLLTSAWLKEYYHFEMFSNSRRKLLLAMTASVVLTVIFFCLLRWFGKLIEKHRIRWDRKALAHPAIKAFAIIAVCWMLFLIVHYPGMLNPDSRGQLGEFFGEEVFTAHHPPLSSCIMGMCVSLGIKLVSYEFGIFLYCALQNMVGALASAYVSELIYDIFKSAKVYAAAVIFYALCPIWLTTCIECNKDALYTWVQVLLVAYIIRTIYKKERFDKGCRLIIPGVLTMAGVLLRKNGLHELLFFFVCLLACFCTYKNYRHTILFLACLAVFTSFAAEKVVYPALSIKSGSVREALSVPFQQTERCVYFHSDNLSEEEKKIIDGVLNYEYIRENYNPNNADEVKGTYREDGRLLKPYFMLWLKMFFEYPGTYITAFLVNNYGYLAPVKSDNKIKIGGAVYDSIYEVMSRIPIVQFLLMPGFYTWCIMLCIYLLLVNGHYRYLGLVSYPVANILICLLSPLANSMRYMLPTVALVPLMICLTIYKRIKITHCL